MVQSVKRLATSWTVRGSNPDWGEIFRTRSDRPWGPPRASLLSLGLKRPGAGVDHPPQSRAEVKERVRLNLYYPSGPSCPVLGSGELGSVVVKALLYKLAGRGFESRWCHWNFSVT